MNTPNPAGADAGITDTTLASAIDARTHDSRLAWLAGQQTFWVTLAALLAFAGLSLASDVFATQQNLFNVARNFAFVAIIAIGMTAVIVTGGIDLSVGAVLVLSGMVTGMAMNSGMSIWLAVPLGLAAALAVGAFNGVLIAYVGVPPFVVTLGMLSIARSLAMVLSDNRMVYSFGPDQPALLALGGGFLELALPFVDPVRIPNPLIFMLVLMVCTSLAFRWSRWGRYLFAIGGNERAATLTGVPVKRVKVGVYMFCALCAGLTGVLEVGWLGTITTGLGQGMELTVIAAAVIGGANLSGGIGSAFGAVVGAALIEVIRNSLTLLGISTFWQGTFVGTFIVIAVLFDRLRSRSANE
ncbi:MAG TPA: ABC transporter permease [Piscinibacter sp.]|jgi:ribose transport system permease protein|uniref:ABC transporter permease n=1 Tax=Piscinibacter sp. TaxID=1903157 RepID=UPI001DC7C790|nr:ABC transporter permease [Piscinibacter sp.]MBK7531616.1 ABC transporter permease [Piscinibacter sp.]HOY35049.1 ABC transporter permease [Piscinibacter sp.]HPG77747.1 ABC transporter permease [Piscinibacter sp.]HPM65014.1 ABC transporter permease [Piscinibacter sp.]